MAKGFKAGSGGGAPLNFKVVGGTSQPSNPKENTIWVNTDKEITGWHFGVENPYIEYRDINLMDGLTFGKGYFTTSGGIADQEASHPELYTNEYIPVKYGSSYTWEYSVSATNEMWLSIVEYTGSYTFKQRLTPVSSVNGTFKSGTYTPSASNVTAVRLCWRTFTGATYNIKFTEHFVGATEGSEGKVWIFTGTSSPVSFNSLKKNGIQVYPLSAKQYVGGALVKKEAKSYQNGEWAKWIAWLYKDGEFFEDLTGAISKIYSSVGSTKLTYNETNINLVSNGGNGIYAFENLFDLSDKSKLCFEYKLSGSGSYACEVRVTSTKSVTSFSSHLIAKKTFTSATLGVTKHEIDISSVDSGYIGFSGTIATTSDSFDLTIYKLWLE